MTSKLVENIHNNKLIKKIATSYEGYLNNYLNNIERHVNQHLKKNLLGMIQLQNLAAISFTYNPKFSDKIVRTIINIFKKKFSPLIYIERISIDSILFCIATENDEIATDELKEVFLQIKSLSLEKSKPIYICFNCGTTLFFNKRDIHAALNEAYIALFESKNKDGHVYCRYDLDISQGMIQHENYIKLAAYFQQSIIEKRLRLAFQPIIESRTGKVRHYEALLRIVTEDNNIISAGPFIPIAETMRFIDQIDLIVLEMVVSELKFNPSVNLAMNISNVSIDNIEWLKKARKLLSNINIANRLTIEITETRMHKDLNKVAHFTDILQSMGCNIAIDDFGAGYTSFSQLKIVHADLVKIDGMFIRDIVDNYDSRLFVQTLLEFAHSFGIKAVAEFVENGEIAKVLIDMNIDYMQGNYFSPAVNYRAWIKEDRYKLLSL